MEAVQHSWLINLTIQFYFGGPSFILYMWQSGQSAEAVVRLALWVNVYIAKLTYIHSLPPWSIWSWTHQAMTEVARGRNWLVFKEWVLLSTCFSQLLQLRLPCHEQSYSIEISSHSPWIVVYPHIVDSGISIQSDLLVVYPFNSGISIQSDFLVTSFISHIPTKLWPPSQITNQSQWVAIDWCVSLIISPGRMNNQIQCPSFCHQEGPLLILSFGMSQNWATVLQLPTFRWCLDILQNHPKENCFSSSVSSS